MSVFKTVTKSPAISSSSSLELAIQQTVPPPVTHVTYNNNNLVVMSDMTLDKQNELRAQMEAEKGINIRVFSNYPINIVR